MESKIEIKNKNKYIIFIRHGERYDKYGDISKFGKYDTELSENGLQSSYILGSKLYEYISNNMEPGNKIKIYSSPYMRAIETSIQIIKGIIEKDNKLIEKKIYLKNQLSEINTKNDEKLRPENYLNSINKSTLFEEYNKENIEIIDDNNIYDLPFNFEEGKHVQMRMKKVIDKLLKEIKDDNINNIIILVTHASPIYGLNKILKHYESEGIKSIKETDCYIYSVSTFGYISFVDKISMN